MVGVRATLFTLIDKEGRIIRPFLLFLATLLAACAPLDGARVGAGTPLVWQPSPNFDERRPNFVILHQTSNETAAQALRTLTDPVRKVSAHYLVSREGGVFQLVDERARAWHAGESWWGGVTDFNSASLGIELDNTGEEPFAEAQMLALLDLLADIKSRYRIPEANFLGHGDIAPRRKVDPSGHFPWRRLARHGYGLWCDDPPPAPPTFDALLGLALLGYAVDAESAGADAVRAFRRHWAGKTDEEPSVELDAAERAMLHCLLRRRSGFSP